MPRPDLPRDTTAAQGGLCTGAGQWSQSPSTPVVSPADAEAPPESSPLWGLVLILGEIAVRIERCQKEHAVVDENAA